MAVYQNTIANLGVKLEITHASPDVANNRTTITYKASVYKTGSHNPWNALSQTPMSLTINGQSLHSTATGNYDLRSGTYEQVIKTGTLVVPHGADGSKSFTFSWNVNFTSTGYGYGNVTTSGTYVLPNIARASTFTIPSTTITTGSAFTVTIARASGSFTHKVSYIVGNSEVVWTSSAATSYAATVPHSLFNSHRSTASVSGVIRVTTMNGSVEVGSNQRTVTINLVSTAIPKVGSLASSNSNTSVFSNTNQYIRGISRLTSTAGSVSGSYSSTIASYEFRVVRSNGTTIFGATSKTTSSHQFSAFDFPNSSSEVVTPQVRVRDSRGRYSAWRAASAIRVHYYAPPVIGTTTVRRVGSANTTLQVTRNYSITLLYQGGSGSNLNTASLWFQHRTKGSTAATNNTGAKSTTTSLTNSNANLSGTFAANTSYEVRAILDDGVAGRVIGSWISVGTEFVPMDIGPKGLGVGKVHSNGNYDLEVGSGGINSEGTIRTNGKAIQAFRITTDSGSPLTTVANLSNRVTGLESISTTTTNSPVNYGTVLGLNGFEILIGSDNSARFRRWSGSPSVAGKWLNAMDKDGTLLPSNANLNSYTDTGYYYNNTNAGVATFTNAPTKISAGYMEVFYGGTMIWQRWTNYRGTHGNKTFVRNAESRGSSWGSWVEVANMSDIPTVPTISSGFYPNKPVGFVETAGARILYGTATATGNSTSTFNSLGNTVTFPQSFSSNTSRPIAVTYSITSNVTALENRMITVNIRNVSRTGFTWDARDSASGTSPSGGTVYTLRWMATGSR